MAIFNSYVSLPEDTCTLRTLQNHHLSNCPGPPNSVQQLEEPSMLQINVGDIDLYFPQDSANNVHHLLNNLLRLLSHLLYIYTSRIMCLPNHRWLRDGFLRANLNNPSQATTCGGSSETGSKSGPLRLELCVIYDPEALYSCPA